MSIENRESLQKIFVRELLKGILPNLVQAYPEVREALDPEKRGVGISDVELAFWAVPELPDNNGEVVDGLALALDIILHNQRVDLERRKQIIEKYREQVDSRFGIGKRKTS